MTPFRHTGARFHPAEVKKNVTRAVGDRFDRMIEAASVVGN